nr:SLC13 family permease [Tissierella sp.]
MIQQIIVFIVILATLYGFIDGRVRYEFVSLSGLLALVITGVIEAQDAFLGFSHPAVITVASVLVISSALIKSGIVEHLVVFLNKKSKKTTSKIMSLMIVTALLSAFMNNVGALALIMPIAIKVAKDNKISPSVLLMPVAFASLLGGMMTQIGTPPNLIVSSYRMEGGGEAFKFFDFAPVGVVLTFVGILFTVLIGWKIIPARKPQGEDSLFNIEDYLSEVVVTKDSKMIGKNLIEFSKTYKLELNIMSIIREDRTIVAPSAYETLEIGDVLIIRAVTSEISDLVKRTGLALKGAKIDPSLSLSSDNMALVEVVLREDSFLIGRTAIEIKLRNRFSINLIAVSRRGISSFGRLKSFRFKSGDILLMQVPTSILQDTYSKLRCLPLAEREIGIESSKNRKKEILPLAIFVISIIITTLGLLPVQIAFAFAAISLVLLKIVTPREFYEAIEWPTILMLGSLLPLGSALQSSGGSNTIANILSKVSVVLPAYMMVVVVMVITIILTNLISNSASAVLMAPIAFSLAQFMGVSPDALLMSVSVASSAAFLTPIAHQSNMLVMGPGGYKFTDYWKLGLPITILVLVIGTPLILYMWPL